MKKRAIFLALSVVPFVHGADLDKVVVEESINTQIVKDVSGKEIKSADLAEALEKNIPSVNLIRRSGIANDILLRGQKRDNINIIIDGTKVCGACVNRMDPPTSHVLTNNIDTVEVKEGPFDVENFGTLSGVVNIKTKKPTKELSGDITANVGSFGYQKLSGSISGGTDRVKVLISASNESGEQYEDGNGDDFVGQIAKNIAQGTVPAMAQYQDKYKNMDAFEKSTFMGKIFVDVTDDQELRVSYTANRSDDVLYPSSKMDALYDDSDIYNLEYDINNLGKYSKSLNFQAYQSEVDHPMGTNYRIMGAKMYKIHALTTKMQGIKLKNSFDINDIEYTVGVDTSKRNWDGHFENNKGVVLMKNGMMAKSLDDVDTTNNALFIKTKHSYGITDFEFGLRYDDTTVESASSKEPDNDYDGVTGNIFATIHANDTLTYFAGIGKSSRVPDPRELYLIMMGNHYGTPNLDQTKNYEIDLGFEKIYGDFSLKTKLYYSMLKDYIAYNSSNKTTKADGTKGSFHTFENVDATIYGLELSGNYLATDNIYLNYGLSYKKGEKDDPLTGQKGTDLADMRPLKANIAINYDNDSIGSAKLEFIGADRWSDIDYENGEQELAGYGVLNLKLSHDFKYGITLTAGVDNILDKTYAITNTYKDLVLLTTGSDTMLLNEPGRYFYLNGSYKF
jgi:iron complex outermembrane receptor protein